MTRYTETSPRQAKYDVLYVLWSKATDELSAVQKDFREKKEAASRDLIGTLLSNELSHVELLQAAGADMAARIIYEEAYGGAMSARRTLTLDTYNRVWKLLKDPQALAKATTDRVIGTKSAKDVVRMQVSIGAHSLIRTFTALMAKVMEAKRYGYEIDTRKFPAYLDPEDGEVKAIRGAIYLNSDTREVAAIRIVKQQYGNSKTDETMTRQVLIAEQKELINRDAENYRDRWQRWTEVVATVEGLTVDFSRSVYTYGGHGTWDARTVNYTGDQLIVA